MVDSNNLLSVKETSRLLWNVINAIKSGGKKLH